MLIIFVLIADILFWVIYYLFCNGQGPTVNVLSYSLINVWKGKCIYWHRGMGSNWKKFDLCFREKSGEDIMELWAHLSNSIEGI